MRDQEGIEPAYRQAIGFYIRRRYLESKPSLFKDSWGFLRSKDFVTDHAAIRMSLKRAVIQQHGIYLKLLQCIKEGIFPTQEFVLGPAEIPLLIDADQERYLETITRDGIKYLRIINTEAIDILLEGIVSFLQGQSKKIAYITGVQGIGKSGALFFIVSHLELEKMEPSMPSYTYLMQIDFMRKTSFTISFIVCFKIYLYRNFKLNAIFSTCSKLSFITARRKI